MEHNEKRKTKVSSSGTMREGLNIDVTNKKKYIPVIKQKSEAE